MVTDEQLAAYLVGEISGDERESFEQTLIGDSAAIGELLRQRKISAGLHALLGDDGGRLTKGILASTRGIPSSAMAERIVRIQTGRVAVRRNLALAAIVMLGAFGIFTWQRQQPVAQIGRTAAAMWSAGNWKHGDALRRGSLKLEHGVAEIRFTKGARVVIEAPADFELTGNNGLKLQSGRLSANVPPSAHGFTVTANGFSVVDHGTEFGVAVSNAADGSRKSEVHVFKGDVVLKAGGERHLKKNDAVRIGTGSVESIPDRPDQFSGSSRLTATEAAEELAMNPATRVHLDFEGKLTNGAAAGQGIAPEVSGCNPTDGRWPGKGALEWKSAGDCVHLTIPGEFQTITLAAWIRVDALPHLQSSLLMSQSEMPGDVHWFLHEAGKLGFSVIGSDGKWHNALTPSSPVRGILGKWTFFATTFDGSNVTHYVNGLPVTTVPLAGVLPLRPGAVEVGNWGRPSTLRASLPTTRAHGGLIRNLNGRMDEFALMATALSAQEILDLYEKTRAATDIK
ncbi:MAG: LamG-like jellyroll fold domain-containing protein [Luteolibacter sp.]